MKERLSLFILLIIFSPFTFILLTLWNDIGISNGNSLGSTIYFVIVSFISVLIFFISWLVNYVALDNDSIYIQSFLTFKTPGHAPRGKLIDTKNIREITVQTTTPFIPIKINISEVNWRDKIHLLYTNENDQLESTTIDLFIFPGFKKIILKLLEKYPYIKISFTKNTVMQNLTGE